VLLKHALERFSQILKQMEAICHLHSIRCSTRCTVSILTRPIPTNNLNTGVILEPGDQCVGRTVGEQINRLMSFKIDQDGSEHLTFA
jgi:hypothetical protein